MVVLAIVLANKAGGFATVMNEVPEENFKFLPRWEVKEIVSYIAAWCVLGLRINTFSGRLSKSHVFQHSEDSGVESVMLPQFYISPSPCFLFLLVFALSIYIPNRFGDTQLALPTMVMKHTSMPIQILFFGSLLSAIMSTTSSAILGARCDLC